MRGERDEEAAALLSAYQQAAQRDANRMRQRRRAIRTLFLVIGAAAVLVGCIAAVDVFALNGVGGDTMTLEVTTAGVDDENEEMEAQFGWSSIGYGWCSVKSSTWCMFSKDKEKCKEDINCYKDQIESRGSGSGDGSVTVGDSSDEGEDEGGEEEGGEEGGEEESHGYQMGGEEDDEEESGSYEHQMGGED
ncbi:hypothetical protein PHMEG_00018670 [Phytophthora megakarya]|uniref:Uncharacterized protein n=1 Tax=Phytophthora megakarya TaxID=4795 RepID=A0A225VUT4_9STRA|nr:hypothetical protein PHMEG_00018670 [Phytophthora megakarya]